MQQGVIFFIFLGIHHHEFAVVSILGHRLGYPHLPRVFTCLPDEFTMFCTKSSFLHPTNDRISQLITCRDWPITAVIQLLFNFAGRMPYLGRCFLVFRLVLVPRKVFNTIITIITAQHAHFLESLNEI